MPKVKPSLRPANVRMSEAGNVQLNFWIAAEDAELLKRAAEIDQRSVAAFIRRHAVPAAEKIVAAATKAGKR